VLPRCGAALLPSAELPTAEYLIQENHMFETLKSGARSLGAAGAGLALVGIAALPVHAQTSAPAQAPVTSIANQIVVRDSATGELRAATAEEALVMQARSGVAVQRKSVAATPLTRVHPSGARGARLTDEFMSYSVVVRQADGTLATLCFESREEAEAALKAAPVPKPSNLATE
jgi:hypothetical protein